MRKYGVDDRKYSDNDWNYTKDDDNEDIINKPVGDDVLHARAVASRCSDHVDPPAKQVTTHTHTGKN